MNNLAWRVVTAGILIPLVLAALFFLSSIQFAIASGILFALAFIEWLKLCQIAKWGQIIGVLLFLSMLGGLYWGIPDVYISYASFVWIYPIGFLTFYERDHTYTQQRWPLLILGFLLLAAAWLALNVIRQLSPYWILTLLLLVWSTDTFAYFVGRIWGKKPLAPQISPKKTIAGFWGGLLGTLLLSIFVPIILHWTVPAQFIPWFLVVLIIIVMSVIGDLFESLMKRVAGVKDSGHWLPGHGGLLDRIDSLIAALPFFFIGLKFMGVAT